MEVLEGFWTFKNFVGTKFTFCFFFNITLLLSTKLVFVTPTHQQEISMSNCCETVWRLIQIPIEKGQETMSIRSDAIISLTTKAQRSSTGNPFTSYYDCFRSFIWRKCKFIIRLAFTLDTSFCKEPRIWWNISCCRAMRYLTIKMPAIWIMTLCALDA